MVYPGKGKLRIALENFAEDAVTLHRNVLLHDEIYNFCLKES